LNLQWNSRFGKEIKDVKEVNQMRSTRQNWAWERCFNSKGGLASSAGLLRSIASRASTLPQESEELKVIAAKLGNMAQIWNDEKLKQRSMCIKMRRKITHYTNLVRVCMIHLLGSSKIL